MTAAGPSGGGRHDPAPTPARETASRSVPRLVFGDQEWRRFPERERELLPRQVRPAALRWTWLGLVVVLLVLAGLAVAIGRALW